MNFLFYLENTAPAAMRPTGIREYAQSLAEGLAELGHGCGFLESLVEPGALGPGTPARCVWGSENKRQFLRGILRLRREAAARRPDVLVLADPGAHLASPWLGPFLPPYIPLFHGTELAAWRHRFEAGGGRVERFLDQRLMRRYLARARERVVNSRFTAGLLAALPGGTAGSFVLHPCVGRAALSRPVDQEFTRTTRAGRPGLFLITVGRLSPRKNQKRVLEVLSGLKGRLDFQYSIVGRVEHPRHEAYLGELESLVAEHGLAGRVRFLGGVTEERKVDLIDAHDVYIQLGQDDGRSVEGFGISAIEAAARGKPVLVSDHGGLPETVVPGKTGYCTALQGQGAAEALLALRDPGLRERLGRAGAERVGAEFTPRSMAERLLARLSPS